MIIMTLSVHGQWRLVYVWIMSGPLGEPWIGVRKSAHACTYRDEMHHIIVILISTINKLLLVLHST